RTRKVPDVIDRLNEVFVGRLIEDCCIDEGGRRDRGELERVAEDNVARDRAVVRTRLPGKVDLGPRDGGRNEILRTGRRQRAGRRRPDVARVVRVIPGWPILDDGSSGVLGDVAVRVERRNADLVCGAAQQIVSRERGRRHRVYADPVDPYRVTGNADVIGAR